MLDSGYPDVYLNSTNHLGALCWILLNEEARCSFESIGQFINTQCEFFNTGKMIWPFDFNPPALHGASLTVRVQPVPKEYSYYIQEIVKCENIPFKNEKTIEFFYKNKPVSKSGAQLKVKEGTTENLEEYEIDNDDLADPDKGYLVVDAEETDVSFSDEIAIKRIGEREAAERILASAQTEIEGVSVPAMNGGALGGEGQEVAICSSENKDETEFIYDSFSAIEDLIKLLQKKYACKLISKGTYSLPEIGMSKCHLLNVSRAPRLMLVVELEIENQFLTLLEVDTSDGKVRLSTLVAKSERENYLSDKIQRIGTGVVRNSLNWPTDILNDLLGKGNFTRLFHPESKLFLINRDFEIDCWAKRMFSQLFQLI